MRAVEFQPVWFNVMGIAGLAIGLFGMAKHLEDGRNAEEGAKNDKERA